MEEYHASSESSPVWEAAPIYAMVADEDICIIAGASSDATARLDELSEGLLVIHRFVERVLNFDISRLDITENSWEAEMKRFSRAPTGGFLPERFRQEYQTSEFVRIFLEAEESLALKVAPDPIGRRCWQRPRPLPANVTADLFSLIWKKAASKNFRRRLAVRRFAAEENFRRGVTLIEKLFDRHAKINVIRIDLAYLREHRPTLEQVKYDMSRLMNNYRHNSNFATVVGLIWRLEWAPNTGYHSHLVIFLDGSKTLHDGFAAQKFGRYWDQVIASGRGRHYNCNYRKSEYRRLGIGMISHADSEKRTVLVEDVLRYMTKFDELVRPRLPRGTRTFGTSHLPEPHSGTGRRRRLSPSF